MYLTSRQSQLPYTLRNRKKAHWYLFDDDWIVRRERGKIYQTYEKKSVNSCCEFRSPNNAIVLPSFVPVWVLISTHSVWQLLCSKRDPKKRIRRLITVIRYMLGVVKTKLKRENIIRIIIAMRIDAWIRFGSCANQFLSFCSLCRGCFNRYDWNRFSSSSFYSSFSVFVYVLCMRIIITFVDAFELISDHWVFELLVRSPRAQQDSISKQHRHHKHHSNSQKWKKMELYAKLLFKQKKRRKASRDCNEKAKRSDCMSTARKREDDTAAWVEACERRKSV